MSCQKSWWCASRAFFYTVKERIDVFNNYGDTSQRESIRTQLYLFHLLSTIHANIHLLCRSGLASWLAGWKIMVRCMACICGICVFVWSMCAEAGNEINGHRCTSEMQRQQNAPQRDLISGTSFWSRLEIRLITPTLQVKLLLIAKKHAYPSRPSISVYIYPIIKLLPICNQICILSYYDMYLQNDFAMYNHGR